MVQRFATYGSRWIIVGQALERLWTRMRSGAAGGIPWFAILDSTGKVLSTSNILDSGENIGFPSESSGQTHFANMLKATRQRMSDAEIEKLITAAAEQQ